LPHSTLLFQNSEDRFDDLLAALQLARAGDAESLGVQPYAQHPLRRITLAAAGAVTLLKDAPIQPLRHAAEEKAKRIGAQLDGENQVPREVLLQTRKALKKSTFRKMQRSNR